MNKNQLFTRSAQTDQLGETEVEQHQLQRQYTTFMIIVCKTCSLHTCSCCVILLIIYFLLSYNLLYLAALWHDSRWKVVACINVWHRLLVGSELAASLHCSNSKYTTSMSPAGTCCLRRTRVSGIRLQASNNRHDSCWGEVRWGELRWGLKPLKMCMHNKNKLSTEKP